MTYALSPWFWLLAGAAVIVAWDRNIEDWIKLKAKHFVVWIQTEQMKAQLLREIRAIERDPDRYLDICEQLLKEYAHEQDTQTGTPERGRDEKSQDFQ